MLNCAFFPPLSSNSDDHQRITSQIMSSLIPQRSSDRMQYFPHSCPFTGCTSSRGTWVQLFRLTTLPLCLDRVFQRGTLTCLSSGKQLFPSQTWRRQIDRCTCPLSHLCLFCSSSHKSLPVGLTRPFVNAASLCRFQEVNSMINKRLKDVLFSDQWSELCMDTLSPSGYVLVSIE